MTLFDLSDKEALRVWLGLTEEQLRREFCEANPVERSWYGFNRHARTEDSVHFQKMTVAELFDWWFKRYRESLQEPPRYQTGKQFINECLSALGCKGGKMEERRQRYAAANPALYETKAGTT